MFVPRARASLATRVPVTSTASAYGNPVSLTSEDRASQAFDGNTETAWSVAAFSNAAGNWLQVRLDHPVTTDHLNLVQVLGSTVNRRITGVTISFDGGTPSRAALTAASRRTGGQTIRFEERSFTTLRITIDARRGRGVSRCKAPPGSASPRSAYRREHLWRHRDAFGPPESAGSSSLAHRLTLVMTRDRVSPNPPRSDPELALRREFCCRRRARSPSAGTARISALIPDNLIDSNPRRTRTSSAGAVIGSNERLPGDLNARAAVRLRWRSRERSGARVRRAGPDRCWIQASLTHSVSVDHLDLKVIADRRHSVPTAIRITTTPGDDELVALPAIRDQQAADAVGKRACRLPEDLRYHVQVHDRGRSPGEDHQTGTRRRRSFLPVGIAEKVSRRPVRARAGQRGAPSVCTPQLLRIDGQPVWLRVSGTVGAAEKLQGLTVSGCGPDAKGMSSGPATHARRRLGKDNRLGPGPARARLGSRMGGLSPRWRRQCSAGSGDYRLPAMRHSGPRVRVVASTATSARLEVQGATQPFWLVLGESLMQAGGPPGRRAFTPGLRG